MLVDSVDVLPGGQSSIYGSDAIAGVVNIHLKKKMDGPEADVRYGWTKDGGGTDRRIALADGFTAGGFSLVVGGQYEKIEPIWGYQRRLSDQYFAQGSSPQTAERDWLTFGYFGAAQRRLVLHGRPRRVPIRARTSPTKSVAPSACSHARRARPVLRNLQDRLQHHQQRHRVHAGLFCTPQMTSMTT